MLSERILATLKFFDLQDVALTAFEVHKYLVAEPESLKHRVDEQFELLLEQAPGNPAVQLDTVAHQLRELVKDEKISQQDGFYTLRNRGELVQLRLKGYLSGVKRERLIWRYLKFAQNLPFVRGIALAGSQALGLQRPTSDIDLLIITDSRFMWIARSILTVYFHVLGVRRHHTKIANRFCLNHYFSTIREVDVERNLYKAMEYIKLRPAVYPQNIYKFQKANESWMKLFFPNISFDQPIAHPQTWLQRWGEKVFDNRLGLWLEEKMSAIQRRRIRLSKFNFVKEDELSFHPESKHEKLLQEFFG